MVLSDNVSDGIDDGTEFDENYVEMTEGDSACAEDATSDGYSCNEMDATESCFQWKGQDEVGTVKSSTHIRRRCQNILANQGKPLRPSKHGTVSLQMKF